MKDELIVTGYCRKLDGSRVLCCEWESGGWSTDCLYPACEFASVCSLIEKVKKPLEETQSL
ncbi:MAG: hypothetical protein IKH56_10435 [Oscillospiraceae bacterium]|nr:hypothetical protein [Oscillospiraceae bacterium]